MHTHKSDRTDKVSERDWLSEKSVCVAFSAATQFSAGSHALPNLGQSGGERCAAPDKMVIRRERH